MFRCALTKVAGLTWSLVVAVAAPALGAADGKSESGINKLIGTVPASTNTIVAVDVRAVMQSAYAQAWGWTADGGSKTGFVNPLSRLRGVDQMVAAARMNFATMDPTWETAVMQRSDPKESLPGAAVDKLGGKPTNRGTGGLLLVDLGDGTVAAVHDGDRQLAAQWIEQRTSAKPTGEASDYLRQAAAKTAAGTPIVVAFDLKDAVSAPEAIEMFMGDPPEALASISEGDAAELGKLFATLRGVTLAISADKEPRGEAIVQFGASAAKLGSNAKPVLLELLGRQGMAVTDFKNWEFNVSGDRVTASGPFSMNGVRRVLRTVRTPSQPAARAAKPKTDKPAVDPSNPAAASQKYYQAISEMIDELRPANELGETARWLIRDAKRIDALPILGVDPELVAWGGHVSMSLRDLASIQATGQRQTRAQTSQQNAPMPALVYDTWGGDDTGGAAAAQTKADWNNYNRQRRAAAESVKVTITEQSSGILKELLQSRNTIRVAMTQKHNAEF